MWAIRKWCNANLKSPFVVIKVRRKTHTGVWARDIKDQCWYALSHEPSHKYHNMRGPKKFYNKMTLQIYLLYGILKKKK